MSDSDDEPLTLSGNALSALGEFYAERDARAEKLEKLRVQAIADDDHAEEHDPKPVNGHATTNGDVELSIDAFVEDWGKSQFWYNDETAALYANQLIDGADDDTVIAVVSTPSVFVALKNIMSTAAAEGKDVPKPKIYLLEHDQRFSVFPEFVLYDFMKPMTLPAHLKAGVDRMICDPPFLSEDCQTKMALTLRWLARKPTSHQKKPGPPSADGSSLRVVVCTGERVRPLVTKLYRPLGVRTTTYAPTHRALENEFLAYANFECARWKWVGDGEEEALPN